jgi:DNA-binding HxlR family transcriptional regulator
VACTLDILGDKWTLLVIRDLFLGRTHFKEFADAPEGIATNILTDRLTRLVDFGLVEKLYSPVQSGRVAYRLTPKGKTLAPVMKAIVKWGLEQIEGTAARMNPR